MLLRGSNETLSECQIQSIVTISIIQNRKQYHITRLSSLNEPWVTIVHLLPSLGARLLTGTNTAAYGPINIGGANYSVP